MESINHSKNTSEKNKVGYMSLKFLIANSRDRLHRVKTGSRLGCVLEAQTQENQEVIL